MSKEDNREMLLQQIKIMSEFLKDGRFEQIDLSIIEKEDEELAKNFGQVIESLKIAGRKMCLDSHDIPTISQHLSHISQSTETGIMNAINTAESIMDEALSVKGALETIQNQSAKNEQLEDRIQSINHKMDTIQDNCFSVITALEFEDINRQVMEKVLLRLNTMKDNLVNILMMLNLTECFDKNDSTFLDSLKHIIDIEGANRQSQDMIDEFFEDFS